MSREEGGSRNLLHSVAPEDFRQFPEHGVSQFSAHKFHSSSVNFGSRRLSLLLLPARASETVRDVKGLLRIHQMEASTTKPDLHTGLAQCLPFTFLLLAPLFAHTHLTRILCLLKPREEYEAKILLSPFRQLVPVQFPTRKPVPNGQLIDFI